MEGAISDYVKQVDAAAAYLDQLIQSVPPIALQLGTGLSSLSGSMQVESDIPYADIPHFPISTIGGHDSRLLVGALGGRRVILLSGRAHCYEGYSARRVSFGIRVLQQPYT